MYTEIVEKRDMEAKHIQTAVKVRWNYVISYGKAWRAKQKAMEERFGRSSTHMIMLSVSLAY